MSAPVPGPCGGSPQDHTASEDWAACMEGTKPVGAKRASIRDLPVIDYPAPLIVKNTFIDTEDFGRPLDVFYKEREFRSLPASVIDRAVASQEPSEPAEEAPVPAPAPIEPAAAAPPAPAKQPQQQRFGRLLEPDCSSSCRSTSVGSFSIRAGIDESPSTYTESSTRDSPNHTLSAASPQRSPKLPDYEYPAALSVKNTFLHTDISRSLSLDGFFEERLLHSCPVSGIQEIHGDEEEDEDECEPVPMPVSTLSFASEDAFVTVPSPLVPPTPEPPAFGGLAGDVEAPPAADAVPFEGAVYGLPPPPADSPVLFAASPLQLAAPWWPPVQAAPLAPVAPAAPAGPILRLAERIEESTGDVRAFPTAGSALHYLGTCRPCAHAHSAKGCTNGQNCTFCHLCPPGELKRQQKAKRWAQRKAGVA